MDISTQTFRESYTDYYNQKILANENADENDWRSMSDKQWDKMLDGIDDYVDDFKENLKRLLSGFTDNYRALIVGTNIGGLGTLIASMASLISFKYIAKENRNLRGKYLGIFTASNIIFMIFMLILHFFLR